MRVLALDLGTKTGWATSFDGGLSEVGTLVTATKEEITEFRKLRMDRRGDPRILNLFRFLRAQHYQHALDWIVFEDVQFSSTTQQTQLWSSFRSCIWLMAELGIQIECCPVATLKKFATGSGAATKEMMASALPKKYLGKQFTVDTKSRVTDCATGKILDDNAVDAAHLLLWAKQILKNIK